jgi:hypothetical protein
LKFIPRSPAAASARAETYIIARLANPAGLTRASAILKAGVD